MAAMGKLARLEFLTAIRLPVCLSQGGLRHSAQHCGRSAPTESAAAFMPPSPYRHQHGTLVCRMIEGADGPLYEGRPHDLEVARLQVRGGSHSALKNACAAM